MTMREGERQVSPTLDGIRRDHVARYEFAAKAIPPNSDVIDFACGIGYGAKILADAGHFVDAFDVDREAIDYGVAHYNSGAIEYHVADGNDPPAFDQADVAISFETIEHLEDPRPLLLALRRAAKMLIASVPNQSVYPFAGQAFHFRHYTRHQFAQLLKSCGWEPAYWYGQADAESEVVRDLNGRTVLAICEPCDIPARDDRPKGPHVAILGLGPSLKDYVDLVKRMGGRSRYCDLVWTINALGNVMDCDAVFHMDDVRIQQIRAKTRPASNIAAMLEWMKTSPVPIITSRAHPDFPALVEFPLEDVLNHLGHEYFNSTAAYAVAYAIHVGASKISCFGMDFTYPNSHDAEKGRGCVEFWLGQAAARGIAIAFPKGTTLMDACYSRPERLYGYDAVNVAFDVKPDGRVALQFTDREQLPTADEIERRYDHSAHPNAIVAAGQGGIE